MRDPLTMLKKNKLLEKKKKSIIFCLSTTEKNPSKQKNPTKTKPKHVAADTCSVLFSRLPPSYMLGTLLGEVLGGKALSEFAGEVVLQLPSGVAKTSPGGLTSLESHQRFFHF